MNSSVGATKARLTEPRSLSLHPRPPAAAPAPRAQDIRSLVRRFEPGADGRLRETAVCLYTNTPDEHFWIDRHPAHPQVLIVNACGGAATP